jgi:hydrogenase maturation protein HypF
MSGLRTAEEEALLDKSAPIVLCKNKRISENKICTDAIAPGLDKTGILLPYSPLLSLLSALYANPLIATSGNISGSPIIYDDTTALMHLFETTDLILSYDREIIVPQDDSVLQFNENGQKIILRRSRGTAPNYFPNPFTQHMQTILATGAELKAAFALLSKKNLYISQYLGNQETIESQENYTSTLQHMLQLLHTKPDIIITDKHPGYHVAAYGRAFAAENQLTDIFEVQHHKAHFGAVLAEHNLLDTHEPVLGFIWDGTGYGDDGQIWGSEVFSFHKNEMERLAHLNYFPQLLADKMSSEPRLSALSLLKDFPDEQYIIEHNFSSAEWTYYQKLVQSDNHLHTSSMGRFLDGLACMLNIKSLNTYEGEAALCLETLARKCTIASADYYALPLKNGTLEHAVFLRGLLNDLKKGMDTTLIARKIFYSLAKAIEDISNQFNISCIAFSGGVFQNTLLTDMITDLLNDSKTLYFHKQLSPNDECIGFGQLACFQLHEKSKVKQQENQIIHSSLTASICV